MSPHPHEKKCLCLPRPLALLSVPPQLDLMLLGAETGLSIAGDPTFLGATERILGHSGLERGKNGGGGRGRGAGDEDCSL